MAIRNLMVEGRVEPIAVDPKAPIFSFETDRAEGLFSASLFVSKHSMCTILTGKRLLVYFAPVPILCVFSLSFGFVVYPQ